MDEGLLAIALSSASSVSDPTPMANNVILLSLAASAAFLTSSWDLPSVRTTAILVRNRGFGKKVIKGKLDGLSSPCVSSQVMY